MRALARHRRDSATPRCRTCRPSRSPGLAGYESSLWQALVAPAATPPAIIARLNREVDRRLNESGRPRCA